MKTILEVIREKGLYKSGDETFDELFSKEYGERELRFVTERAPKIVIDIRQDGELIYTATLFEHMYNNFFEPGNIEVDEELMNIEKTGEYSCEPGMSGVWTYKVVEILD